MVTPDWEWRARFLLSWLSGDRALMGPFAAAVDVTRRCNLTCFGCPSHAPGAGWRARAEGDDVAWDDFQRACSQLRQLGTRKLILIGEGEPLLHPRILDLIAEGKRNGFFVVLFTNGTMLAGDLAPAIAASGLDELRISLWAADEQEYARNYGGCSPRLFQRVLDGARAVSRARTAGGSSPPNIVLHRPIDRESFRGLERMVGLARESGCDALSFSPLKPTNASARDRALTASEAAELRPILRRTGRLARDTGLACNDAATLERYRIGEAVWEHLPCYLGWLDVRIRSNGDVQACATCRRPMGNIRREGLAEIWNGQAFRQFRRNGRTRGGLADLAGDCNCGYCCHVLTNGSVHRVLRWVPRLR